MKKDRLFVFTAYAIVISMIINATPLWFFGSLRRIPVWGSFFFLILIRWKEIVKSRYFFFISIFFVLIVISYILRLDGEYHASPIIIINWILPILLFSATRKEEWYIYKPLGYAFIALFVVNCFMSYYERLTFSYVLNYQAPWVGELFKDVAETGENHYQDILLFRPMALFGHPLNNGNIMSFLTFSIFYSNFFNKYVRFFLLILGTISIICFNSRGSIMIFFFMLSILTFRYLVNQKESKLARALLCFLIVYLFFITAEYFEIIGGRFVTSSLDDDSSQVRVDAIKYFLSLSFGELLFGGVKIKYGENGVLMLIEELGLIFGTLFVFLHVYFSWVFLKYRNSLAKILIFTGFFVVSSTNNNLYYPLIFSIYILVIICLNNSYIPQNYKKNDSGSIKKRN